MNKMRILLLFAISAALFACGSQDGGGPPVLKNSGIVIISPFDTLVAEFDTRIVGVKELDSGNIKITQNMLRVYNANNDADNKLYFVGKFDSTPGGLSYFKPGEIDYIEFSNLKNEDGYVQKKAVLSYSTHKIFDSEHNSTELSADDLDGFGNKTTYGFTFVGVLDSLVAATELGNIYDTEDYFKLMLHTNDIIEITASSRDTAKVQFYGPGNDGKIMTVKNSNTIKDTITGTGHLLPGEPWDKEVPFYIKVYTEKNNSRPNPYKISILRKKG